MRTVLVLRSGEYQPIKYVPFNPGSRDNIKLWMEHDHGYTFPFYTPKGKPKVDIDSLATMSNPAGKLLKRYLKVAKDQSQVGGADGSLIKNYDATTHTVRSRTDTNGTVTGRFTSSSINLAQIPAQKEFRELFSAPTFYTIPNTLYSELQNYINEG